MIIAAQQGAARSKPRVLVDLSDPARRTDREVHGVLGAMAGLGHHARVTLGLNLAEAERVAMVMGVARSSGGHGIGSTGADLCAAARDIGARLGLDTVVIHPREGCAAADASRAVWFDGPLCAKPRLSTGAGDHFNAGFGLAQAMGLPMTACCAMGCATSGAYVRDAQSPTRSRLADFLEHLPGPA
jgi:sugar/nucleoside kinase (ribokinase family)